MIILTQDELLLEQMAEAIDATDGPFDRIPWTGEGHYRRFERLVSDLKRHNALREYDTERGRFYCRTDVPCSLEEPTRTLYRLFDAEGVLLYVGLTTDLPGRLAYHAKTKDWWCEVESVTQKSVRGWVRSGQAERQAIETEAPLYNVLHNPNRPLDHKLGRSRKSAA